MLLWLLVQAAFAWPPTLTLQPVMLQVLQESSSRTPILFLLSTGKPYSTSAVSCLVMLEHSAYLFWKQ